MELKSKLEYTNEKDRIDFVVENSHNRGYEIKEYSRNLENGNVVNIIEAWGKDGEELLEEAKHRKLSEALEKAYEYENKIGFVTFDGRPVDGSESQVLSVELFNQSKFFQLVVGFTQGLLNDDFLYSTKEDVVVFINVQEAQGIYLAITQALSKLWTVNYPRFKQQILDCETIDDVNAVVIDYSENSFGNQDINSESIEVIENEL